MALKNNYSVNSNRPAFSMMDDDDAITSAFMSSSSATYLAADKLPYSAAERAVSEEEQRRDELLQQMRQVEQRTLDSSKRSIGLLIESEKVGIETAEDISRQREQLNNTETRLDDINHTLKDTQKNINGIKSVFSSLKQWWSAPKNAPTEDKGETKPKSPQSLTPSVESKPPVISKHLSSAVENSQSSIHFSQVSHPALRLKGLEDDNYNGFSSDFKAQSQKVNDTLDEDLQFMSSGLSRLKQLAQGLGTEIEDQNQMIERIHTKADKADITISSQNTQMKKILKK